MVETDDMQLLRQYAGQRTEAAFAELVRRHVHLVHSVALRQTGDIHRAQEVTQAVFIILARKAGSLGPRTLLSGWLYQTARLTAANSLRAERRRVRREQEAYMQSQLNEPSADAWQRIAPLLDDAMAKLGEADRGAVVLRFFTGKSLAEVGAALGTSEDGARMRVQRALEKLRRLFVKRGVSLTTASLAGALTANAVPVAPAGLAVSAAAAAGGGAAVAVSTLTLVKGVLKLVTISKLQLGAISGAVVAGLVTPLVLEHRANARLRAENLALREQSQPTQEASAPPSVAALDAEEMERQRRERTELLRLRGEIGRLRAAEQELARLRAAASQLERTAALPSTRPAVTDLPKESWTDAGFATPQAALQTRGWAVLNANRERFKESVHITDGTKKLLEAMLEGMISGSPDPEQARRQIRENGLSLEDGILFPMIAEHQQKGYAGYRVLSQQSPSTGETIFEVETAMASGQPKTETLKFQQVNGDWKVVVDEAQVQAELARARK